MVEERVQDGMEEEWGRLGGCKESMMGGLVINTASQSTVGILSTTTAHWRSGRTVFL